MKKDLAVADSSSWLENTDGKKKINFYFLRRISILLLLTLPLFLNACTHIYTAHGAYYRVQKGDTLASIAEKHKIGLQELAELNNIENDKTLKTGQSLYIPGIRPDGFARFIRKEGGVSEKKHKKTAQKEKSKKRRGEKETAQRIEVDHGRFIWPIQGELSSPFGIRRGRRHDGIDVRSPQGTLIAAAADGEVAFAKTMRGYGNLVLLKHADEFFTVYAHNSTNMVRKGDRVKKGQKIAKVGRTGRATGPHLHFEVREGTMARNPLFFLPKTKYAIATEDKSPPEEDLAPEASESPESPESKEEIVGPETQKTQKVQKKAKPVKKLKAKTKVKTKPKAKVKTQGDSHGRSKAKDSRHP